MLYLLSISGVQESNDPPDGSFQQCHEVTTLPEAAGGLEGKYFTTSAQQAARYAREAVKAFGDAPYTMVQAHAPQSLLETPGMSATIEKGIQAYHIPNQALPGLRPEILNYSPIL
jgi:hypothetical protein